MNKWGLWIVTVGLLFQTGCRERKNNAPQTVGMSAQQFTDSLRFITADTAKTPDITFAPDTKIEAGLRERGLLDVREVDPSIAVYLIYATSGNFTGRILYKDLYKAFLLPEAAQKLALAQRKLKMLRPGWSLIVYDAARPMSIQAELWRQVRGTDKRVFVSNPANGGGLHNYGAAVDVSLVDSLGVCLDMGCPVDYFGTEARPDKESDLMKSGRITGSQLENRRLLRRVMTDAGFRLLPSEWWHFNLVSREEAKERLQVIP